MGRWTQYDEDDHRLPEGMKRVGYDADSGSYYFRDSDGSFWEGSEGAEFGQMRKVASPPSSLFTESSSNGDVEAVGASRNGYHTSGHSSVTPTSPYRTLFPFFLIIITSLLLVWRVFLSPSPPFSGSTPSATPTPACAPPNEPYEIHIGDTCWNIAQARGSSVDALKTANSGLVCSKLQPGQHICVPSNKQKRRR